MRRHLTLPLSAVAVLVALAGCGGGGDSADAVASPDSRAAAEPAPGPDAQISAEAETDGTLAEAPAWAPADAAPAAEAAALRTRDSTLPAPAPAAPMNQSATTADRAAAATATANSTTNECAPIRPFYWEIGDRSAALVAGSLTSSATTVRYESTTNLQIASASKWVYGTYVAQKLAGVLSDTDRRYLSMRAGYGDFLTCLPGQTVGACQAYGPNGTYSAADDGKFEYSGGHMQKHAVTIGIGTLKAAQLTTEVKAVLGGDIALAYSPQIAGGVTMSSAQFAKLLRKILGNQLFMGGLLGSGAVCTNSRTCAGQAVVAPVPLSESWHYSVGHWIEDDPVVGDGAFSSPGAFGFYPWIDAGKQFYGIVARQGAAGSGFDSVTCGRKIRKAWLTATSQ